jgi:hypothetical protein
MEVYKTTLSPEPITAITYHIKTAGMSEKILRSNILLSHENEFIHFR